jgi:Asp-tRNA(Asn)/Glu-tRNA(Gln) amidotransferase A subunit family amidase
VRSTNQPEGSLTEASFAIRDLGLHSYLDRVEERFAEREPAVQAFVPEEGRFARLHRDAEALLDAWPRPDLRPYLFGVPVGIKDVFHVDGLPTRAGSRLPPEALRGTQAKAVTALREKGALILGKTVSTEFAYFAPGPTRNPHHPEHTPGGSSSGSAAAVAAGLCPLALGTQTIGSVIRPAAFCGIVGFKPSEGRISTQGLIPLAPSLDHVGYFTVDVTSASVAAMLLCEDWFPGIPRRMPVLGIPEGPYLEHASEEGLAHFRDTCDWLSSRYRVRSVPAMPDYDKIVARHDRLLAAEAARVHADWFPRFSDLYAPQTAELIARGQKVTPGQMSRDRAGRKRLRAQLETLMEQHRIDLWLSPAAPGPAPHGLDSTGKPIMNIPWTQAGLPTLCVPAGKSSAGLPMGLQITGRWWSDPDLIEWGKEIARVAAL